MYDIYGIVKVKYSSYNKGEYFVSISHIITLILPKCAKTREQECQASIPQVICSTNTISANAGMSHKKEEKLFLSQH